MPELNALINEHVKRELNQSLTAVDIYVGDDHLRISCPIDRVDRIMADVMALIRIPGETVVCHEVINLNEAFTDYSKWPLVSHHKHLANLFRQYLKLVPMLEYQIDNYYVKTTAESLVKIMQETLGKHGNLQAYWTRL